MHHRDPRWIPILGGTARRLLGTTIGSARVIMVGKNAFELAAKAHGSPTTWALMACGGPYQVWSFKEGRNGAQNKGPYATDEVNSSLRLTLAASLGRRCP